MEKMRAEEILYKNKLVIGLFFPYDNIIIQKVKQIKSARWSYTLRAWIIDKTKSTLVDFQKNFEEVEIKKLPNESKLRFFDLSIELTEAVSRFEYYLYSKRYSENTIKVYKDALLIFFRYYHEKKLNDFKAEDLIEFNNAFILKNKFSASYQNQVVNAVKLFFTHIAKKQVEIELIHRPRREKKLPNVLSKEEVKAILDAPVNLKHRAMLSLIYSCGLRRSELLNLRLRDIDSNRKLVLIKQGKGMKDRIVPLSEKILELLRDYYKAYRPKEMLFEGQTNIKYSAKSLQSVLKQSVVKAKINKPITLHWLRHSYATHLLENGTDLRYIQELLGHSSSRTTEIYTHVSTKNIQNITSPYDFL